MSKTVVIGASPNPQRYSYTATEMLVKHNVSVIPVGLRPGSISGEKIITERRHVENVDTITLYVGPHHQHSWTDYIFSLKPRRVIFNPGTENVKLEASLSALGIETERACTLVLISTGQY